MAREKRKKLERKHINRNNTYSLRNRRSSMKVNLSYVSNLSSSENNSMKRISNECSELPSEESINENNLSEIIRKSKTKNSCINNDTITPVSVTNVTVINAINCSPNSDNVSEDIQNNLLTVIKEKEQQLNKSCMQLKDAIMNKTQALFDKENELAIKTSEVLATVHGSNTNIDMTNDKRSPSIKINIGKNDQIIMSGDGRKDNPVQVLKHQSLASKSKISPEEDEDNMDCNQSIVSTPKNRRSESYTDKSCDNIYETILRIPVARLFAENNNPNNSMSEMNLIDCNSSLTTDVADTEASKNNLSNISEVSNELNHTSSPILSQGIRISRISRLSLKKQYMKNLTEASTKITSNTVTESFIERTPLTCSSFVEEQNKKNNQTETDKSCTTVNLHEKSNTNTNCKVINIDNNGDNGKTVESDGSINPSSMELTKISSHMPIIRRSFQNIIRESLNLDKVNVANEDNQNHNIAITNSDLLVKDTNKDSNKNINNLEPMEQVQSTVCQEDCSVNTVRTSLNVNTSLDNITLADCIIQKGNKKLIKTTRITNKENMNKIEEENNTTIVQHQNTCNIRFSMQVNTSLDSMRKSSITNTVETEQTKSTCISSGQSNSTTNQEKNINEKVSSRQSTTSINPEKEINEKIVSRQPSISTVRSSMQVNTSLDSARKSPITKNVLDYNKILSMVEETSFNNNQSKTSTYSSKDHCSDNDDELENVSLMERIRNISATTKNDNFKKPNQAILNIRRKSVDNCTSNTTTNSNEVDLSAAKINADAENTNLNTTKKSVEIENISSTTNDSSIIEATPYPASRSVLLKTMIKNNIAMNTLNSRKFIDFFDGEDSTNKCETVIHKTTISSPIKYKSVYARKKTPSPNLLDTVVLNSSDESSNESDKEKEPVIIDESLSETKDHHKSINNKESDDENKHKNVIIKRKLYPLRENSQLISFSPADIQEPSEEIEPKTTYKKRKQKVLLKKKQANEIITQHLESVNESEPLENEIYPKKGEKIKKKPRKINSKKIVIKKVTNMSILDNILCDEEKAVRLSDRNSLREFDLRRVRTTRKENLRKNHKIIMVVTGLPKEEKDTVKSVIKALGSATLEVNVTPRTTHIISSGIRTINLLKGIIRGCWLLSLEWAIKSLENGKWLDPSPYEMSHFSKAVQENRRDRQLFGKAYVPELFVTCGFIYVENGTSPPTPTLKELIKAAGGRIAEDPNKANIIIGLEGLREIWVLDSITTGEVQALDQYKRN